MVFDFKKTGFLRAVFYLFWILLACRLIFFFVMPLIEPSECRYAAMARNMAESGDYLVPRFVHDGELQSFDGKPPLFFQTAAIACRVFGYYAFSVRIPSLVSALLVLGMLYFTLKKRVKSEAAVAGTLLCFLSPLYYIFTALSLTDTVLMVGICGAIFSYMLFLDAAEKRCKKLWSIGLFACLGIGMIAKGPVGLLMSGLPVLVYTVYAKAWKELKYHSWVLGPIVFLVIAAPWYVLMAKQDPGFLEYFFINENFKRFITPDYGDRYGAGRESFRGMSILWFLMINAPMLVLFVFKPFRRRALALREYAKDPVTGLAFSACAAPVLFWCLTSRVPVYYLLPTVPMFALFCGVMIEKSGLLAAKIAQKRFLIGAAAFGAALVVGLGVASYCFTYHSEKSPRGIMLLVDRAAAAGRVPAGKYCFMGRTPYSAEYYAGSDALVKHPEEMPADTLYRCEKTALIVHKQLLPFLEKNHMLDNRDLLGRYGEWSAYTPVRKGE